MIPAHLRPHLERLGATITPQQDGSTEVRIPGARKNWRIDSDGELSWWNEQLNDKLGGWVPSNYDTQRRFDTSDRSGYSMLTLLSRMAHNEMHHDGPQHRLTLGQQVGGHDGQYHRTAYADLHLTDTQGRPQGTKTIEEVRPEDETKHHQGIRAVLEGQAPIEFLVDELADHHNVSHLVKCEKYARDYRDAISERAVEYSDAYVRAIRYGRAPVGDVNELVKAGNAEGGLNPHNTPDAVLADLLGDHSDPRELIVRRDLEHRQHPDGHTQAMMDKRRELAGGSGASREVFQHDLGDGHWIHLRKNEGPDGTAYTAYWVCPSPHDGYAAVLNPDEAAHVANGLGVELH